MNRYTISLRELTRLLGLAYASVRRWRERARRGRPLLQKPGPQKLEPLDMERFGREVDRLVHGRKRSRGSGALHAAFGGSLSRREIDAHIRQARADYWNTRKGWTHSVRWKHPNLVWAIDDTRFAGRGGYIHTVRDLASRYQFEPLGGSLANGEQVAAHLDRLFRRHGAPLLLKRDNGSNLNDSAVNEVLAQWRVIPLNSPTCCPQYNGAIENAQKDWDRFLDPSDPHVRKHLQLHGGLAAQELNHTPRRVLGGQIPCAVFHGPARIHYTKRQRSNAHEWITDYALELTAPDGHYPARAWRTALLTWLQMNNLIQIHRPHVSPCFPNKCAH
jgi:hypothetical protein